MSELVSAWFGQNVIHEREQVQVVARTNESVYYNE